ncbi:MAG: acetyl-CoA carboxylase biotin carboxyl carrier protein [Candidatus Eisenbacteria bacterium]|nr:acetyl-CoA carboxylase biotin carboxyl carrier protein [Candidatus Eisenbacteria bacterium]
MRVEEIRRLIKLVEESQIDELEVRKWWTRVRIQRKSDNHREVAAPITPIVVSPAVANSPPPAPPAAEATAGTASPAAPQALSPTGEGIDEAGRATIRSPMVGTFYRAASPDSAHYVEPGQRVETGQVVCIIEAMKLMNEIEADVGGTIERVLVEDAQPVEFNQPLFLVKPT